MKLNLKDIGIDLEEKKKEANTKLSLNDIGIDLNNHVKSDATLLSQSKVQGMIDAQRQKQNNINTALSNQYLNTQPITNTNITQQAAKPVDGDITLPSGKTINIKELAADPNNRVNQTLQPLDKSKLLTSKEVERDEIGKGLVNFGKDAVNILANAGTGTAGFAVKANEFADDIRNVVDEGNGIIRDKLSNIPVVGDVVNKLSKAKEIAQPVINPIGTISKGFANLTKENDIVNKMEAYEQGNVEKSSNVVSKKIAQLAPSIGESTAALVTGEAIGYAMGGAEIGIPVLEKFASKLSSAGKVGAAIAETIPTSTSIGAIFGSALFGLSAGRSYELEGKGRGMNDTQALVYGLGGGGIETISELISLAFLGGNNGLITNAFNNKLWQAGIKGVTNVLENGVQEYLTEYAQEYLADMINGSGNFENIRERAMQAGLDGMFQALLMAGTSFGMSTCAGVVDKIRTDRLNEITEQEKAKAREELTKGAKVLQKLGVDNIIDATSPEGALAKQNFTNTLYKINQDTVNSINSIFNNPVTQQALMEASNEVAMEQQANNTILANNVQNRQINVDNTQSTPVVASEENTTSLFDKIINDKKIRNAEKKINNVAKKLGYKVKYTNGIYSENGVVQNGHVDFKTGTIYIDNDVASLGRTAMHEFVHTFKAGVSKEEWNDFSKLILDEINGENGASYQEILDKYNFVYNEKANQGLDEIELNEEMVADIVGKLFGEDDSAFNRLASKNPTWLKKFIDAFEKIIKKFKAAFGEDSKEFTIQGKSLEFYNDKIEEIRAKLYEMSDNALTYEQAKDAINNGPRKENKFALVIGEKLATEEESEQPLEDSQGNKLTKEQISYQKNNKVRDDQGRLIVGYTGSPVEDLEYFAPQEFETSDFGDYKFGPYNVTWFSDNRDVAAQYTEHGYDNQKLRDKGIEAGENVYAVYPYGENPIKLYDQEGRNWQKIWDPQLFMLRRELVTIDIGKFVDMEDNDLLWELDDINEILEKYNLEISIDEDQFYNDDNRDDASYEVDLWWKGENSLVKGRQNLDTFRAEKAEQLVERIYDYMAYGDLIDEDEAIDTQRLYMTTNDVVRLIIAGREEGICDYDAVMIPNVVDGKNKFTEPAMDIITINDGGEKVPMKTIDNKNPTNDYRLRYSLEENKNRKGSTTNLANAISQTGYKANDLSYMLTTLFENGDTDLTADEIKANKGNADALLAAKLIKQNKEGNYELTAKGDKAIDSFLNGLMKFEKSREVAKKKQEKETARRVNKTAKLAHGMGQTESTVYWKNKIAESKAKQAQKVSDTKLRTSIYDSVKTLSSSLLAPTKTKYIPETARKGVAQILEMLDVSKNDKETKTNANLSALNEVYKEIANTNKWSREQYKEMGLDPNLFDDDVAATFEKFKDKKVNELNSSELLQLDNALKGLVHQIENARKVFINGKTEELKNVVENEMLPQIRKKKEELVKPIWKDGIVGNFKSQMTIPAHLMNQIGGKRFFEDQMLPAQDKQISIARDFMGFYTANITDDISKTLRKRELYDIELDNGKTVKFAKQQAMELRELAKDKDAKNHILNGGAAPGKTRKNMKYYYGKINQMTEGDLLKIDAILTDEERDFADALGEFMNTYGRDTFAEASIRQYGYDKSHSGWYYPIKVWNAELDKNMDAKTNKLTNSTLSIARDRTVNASNGILIGNITETFFKYANDISTFAGYGDTIQSLVKMFNYKDGENNVEVEITNRYGKEMYNVLKRMVQNMEKVDLNSTSTLGSIPKFFISIDLGNKIAFKASSAFKQFSAFFKASDKIDMKYLLLGLADNGIDTTKGAIKALNFRNKEPKMEYYNEMIEYSPIAYLKSIGFSESELSRGMSTTAIDLNNGFNRFRNKAKEVGYWGMEKTDMFTWTAFWQACKHKYANQKGITVSQLTEEDLKGGVNKMFRELIADGQVVDSVLHKTDAIKNGSDLTKYVLAYKSEATTMVSKITNGYYEMKTNGGVKPFLKSVAAVGSTVVAETVIGEIISMLKHNMPGDDDDDEEQANFFFDMIENVITSIPYVDKLYQGSMQIIKGYTGSQIGANLYIDIVEDLYKLATFKESKKDTKLKISKNIVDDISAIFGVPTENIYENFFVLPFKAYCDATNDYKSYYKLMRLFENVSNSSAKQDYNDLLAAAKRNGDTESYQTILNDLTKAQKEASDRQYKNGERKTKQSKADIKKNTIKAVNKRIDEDATPNDKGTLLSKIGFGKGAK